MSARATRAILCAAALLVAGAGGAHPMTEKYLPVGAYPGWDRGTDLGTVQSITPGGAMVVRTDAGEVRTQIAPSTLIWLDRSRSQQATQDGRVSDIRPGQRVEIKRRDGYCVWVKVAVQP